MPIYKTEKKKDGLQGYRVRVAFTGPDGKHKQVERTAYGKAEAQLLERRLIDELASPSSSLRSPEGCGNPLPVHTIQTLYDEYVIAKAAEVRSSTLAKTKSILSTHVLPVLGSTPLDALDAPTLQAWKNGVAEKPLKILMKQNAYKELRALLNYAVKLDYLPSNPLVKIGNFRDAYAAPEREKLRYYT